MSKRSRTLIYCIFVYLMLGTSAHADRLWLAGSEFSPNNSYSYIGTILPLKRESLAQGWMQRYWLDWLTYQYDSNNATIEAGALGLEASLGYQFLHSKGWSNIYLGAVYRDTHLSPNDPGNDTSGGKLRPKASLQYNTLLTTQYRLDLIGSYVFNQDGYWSRARLGYLSGNTLQFGPEAILHGDPDYEVIQAGIFISGIKLTTGFHMGVKAGFKMVRDEANHAYIGVEFDGLY